MRVKEMHPLCCISLESPAMGDQSPETRIKLSRSCSVADMRSDGNAAGLTRCGSESCSGSPIFAGVLYKWTNYGKGWRSRWFLLRNGVLSYSKILQLETLAGGEDVRLIGDVSSGRHKRVDRCGSSRRHKNQKTVGIVHLKVSSFRESRSDDRRFYIFTGTKTLDLRTSSKKDRGSWIECLGSTRNPLNLRRLNEISLSTERLKKRLVEEGSRVKDCEQMILLEFSQVKRQVQLLCEERSILLDTLRQLEAANIEGESSGGPEGDDQVTQQEFTDRGKYSEWSRTDSSDDVSKEEGSED